MRRTSLARLAVALATLAAPAAAQDAAARLVPTDATVLVRLESVDAWNALARSFEPIAGDGSLASFDLGALLAGMHDPSAAQQGELDPSRPLYVAVSLPPGGFPVQTIVLPIRGETPIALDPSMTMGPAQSVVLDGWCGISALPGYAARAEPSALVQGLRPGVASVHVDLAALIAQYRPIVDTFLNQLESMTDQFGQEESPMDMQALMEAYVEMIGDLVDSARALDVALEFDGSDLALTFGYTSKHGSEPASAPADVSALAARLDPASSALVVYNGHWADMLDTFGDFLESAVEAYPEPLRDDMERILDVSKEIAPLVEPGIAMDMDLGADGMRILYLLRSKQPAEVVARMEASVRIFDHEGGMMRFGEAAEREIAGIKARVLPFEIHMEALAAMAELPGGETDQEEMQSLMAAMYGREPRFALATSGDLVVLAMAGSDAGLEQSLARIQAAPGPVAPRLARTLGRVPAGAKGFAYCLDLGRVLGETFELGKAIVPDTPQDLDLSGLQASLDMWGAHQGATWTFGMALDTAETIGFVKALVELNEEDR